MAMVTAKKQNRCSILRMALFPGMICIILKLSQTNGEIDGRWIFANGNNTPRIARIDLTTFSTAEILEMPNSAGNHSSPFITENTEYVVAGTRFSVPLDNQNGDVPINTYKKNFKGYYQFYQC